MSEKTAAEKEPANNNLESEGSFGGPKFFPCLYIQRYIYVQQKLLKYNIKSLVDFGSATCKISRFLSHIPTLEKLALVDIDGDVLEANKFLIQPLISDYLVRRETELEVRLYQGSVMQCDRCILGCEAVTMVEIIEHLVPSDLDAAVTMVFGHLKPRVVVMTTPNADYNQLFPGFSGFRHWDHKFEWSQREFREWCEALCTRYSYSVEYGGVGEPPPGSEDLGYCSQCSIFVRKLAYSETDGNVVTDTYRLIASSMYPSKEAPKLSDDDQLLLDINYHVRQFITGNQHRDTCSCARACENQNETLCYNCAIGGYQLDDYECLVPVSYLMKFKKFREMFNLDQFRLFLQNHGYKLTKDLAYLVTTDDASMQQDLDMYPMFEDGGETDSAIDGEPFCQVDTCDARSRSFEITATEQWD